MKTKPFVLLASLLMAGPAFAQQAAAAPTLVPGGEVKPDALAKGEWIQGEAPAEWEPGKVYMLECWATWCGPCLAVIPHVNELHKKYSEKGLRVIGVNVWEDGKEKVANFVKGKGDGMSYPVVYSGKGSDFENDWLKAAGVSGIPHAFLVRDGKLLLKSHPARINDEVIQAALEGGEAIAKIEESMRKEGEQQAAMSPVLREFSKAAAKKDIPAMEAAHAKVKEIDKSGRYAAAIELEIALAKKDWDGVATALVREDVNPSSVMRVARTVSGDDDVPGPLVESATAKFVTLTQGKAGPMDLEVISRLQWKMDKKEDALATARSAVEKAREAKATRASFPVEPFEKFAAALGEGRMPGDEEFKGWLQEAMPKRAPAPSAITPNPAPSN